MKKLRRFLRHLPTLRFDLKSGIVLLALVPTAWAVLCGLTMTDTWPMPFWIAIPGALSLIIVSVSVSSYIAQASEYNKSLKRNDYDVHKIPAWYGWALLVLTTVAEITLALLVNVIPGVRTYSVIAFPMLGLSGVFVYSLRMALAEAIGLREDGRKEAKEARRVRKVAPKIVVPVPQIAAWSKVCPTCGAQFTNPNAYSAHQRWQHPKKAESEE